MLNIIIKKIKRKIILRIIKEAKKVYLNGGSLYMCNCFFIVVFTWHNYTDIVKTIPEFKPATFGIDTDPEKGKPWWNRHDWYSRMEAFDKLIEIYTRDENKSFHSI